MSQDTEEPDGFIHPPDELNDSEENGLVCFMDTARPCGADCMAGLAMFTQSMFSKLFN